MIPIGEPTTVVQFFRRHRVDPTHPDDVELLRRSCLQPAELKVPKKKVKIDKFTFNATLRWLLSSIRGGEATCAEVLRQMPADDPDYGSVQQLLEHWDQQTTKRRSLDLACVALNIAPAMVYGWFAKVSFEIGKNIMKVQVAAAAPLLMQTSINEALKPEGLDERKVLFESIGLTQRRGLAIQQNNLQLPPTPPSDQSGVGFEVDQRRLSAQLREGQARKALPEKVVQGTVVGEP